MEEDINSILYRLVIGWQGNIKALKQDSKGWKDAWKCTKDTRKTHEKTLLWWEQDRRVRAEP